VQGNFNGPALIQGGPGTGKTVVGLHRAGYLAKNIYKSPTDRILMCTYSKTLANYLKSQLDKLPLQDEVKARIDIFGADQLLRKVTIENRLTARRIDIAFVGEVLDNTLSQTPGGAEPYGVLLPMEYRDVVQRYRIRTKEEYLDIDRKGMGTPLNSSARERMW